MKSGKNPLENGKNQEKLFYEDSVLPEICAADRVCVFDTALVRGGSGPSAAGVLQIHLSGRHI